MVCTPYVDGGEGRVTVCTSVTRPTGADRYEGKWIWETDTKRSLVYETGGWIIMAEPTQTYTPTLTNMTLGNGASTGYYKRSDGWIDFVARFVLSSTSAVGTGPTMGLPKATGASHAASQFQGVGIQAAFGTARPIFVPFATVGDTSVGLKMFDASGAVARDVAITATVPHTWTTSDSITISGRYQMTTRYS